MASSLRVSRAFHKVAASWHQLAPSLHLRGCKVGPQSARPLLVSRRSSKLSVKPKVERVNLVDTAITHQQRRAIRSQSYPGSENVAGLRKILEA